MRPLKETINESIDNTNNINDANINLITESDLSEEQYNEYRSFIDDLNAAFEEGGVDACNEFLQKCRDENMYEGFIGGLAGFLVGPSIGKIVARALGMEKGVLYDLLTSRLVSAALGNAIQKELNKR